MFDGCWNNVEQLDTILSRLHCSKGTDRPHKNIKNDHGKKDKNLQQLPAPQVVLFNPLSNSSSTCKSNSCGGFGAAGTHIGNTDLLFALKELLLSEAEWKAHYNVFLLWSHANQCQILTDCSGSKFGMTYEYFKRTNWKADQNFILL